jgi:hypothetical protein
MMSYVYQNHRLWIFTEEGVRDLLVVKDHVAGLLDAAGAVMLWKAIATVSGDSWHQLAIMDYLVELGYLREITTPGVAAQHRVFVGGGRRWQAP